MSPATHSVLDDVALVRAMTGGDAVAMSAIYDRHSAQLFGLALRITREQADAEEVIVDAFAQAWREAERFDATRGPVIAWLTTIVRSRALDVARAQGRRGRLQEAVEAEGDAVPAMGSGLPTPIAAVLAEERGTRVREALTALPAAQRTALELAYFEGLSQSEIAERLDEPLGTIKTRLRLGLRRLRELLAPLGPGALP